VYKRKRVQMTIPEPYETLASLRTSVLANKELTEVLAGQRGNSDDAAVTWGDLLDLGIVKPEQVPPNVGSGRG
jgi:hypothetical protein